MEIYEGKSFRLRLEARLKNAELVRAREILNLTQKEAAELIGINAQTLGRYELLTGYPSSRTRKKICSTYRKLGYSMIEESVFPEELDKIKDSPLSNKFVSETEISPDRLISLRKENENLLPSVEPEVFDKLYREELQQSIEETLSTITDRESEIIRLYFGIDKDRKYTLPEIGEMFNLSRERIRQIKEHAIKRLRHDSRTKKLKQLL